MTKFGYVKIYSGESEESVKQQREALLKAGVDPKYIYEEDQFKASLEPDSEFNNLLKIMRPDDTFIIQNLGRLGNFLSGIVASLEALLLNDISWSALKEGINSKYYALGFWNDIFKILVEHESDARQRTIKDGFKLKGAKPRSIPDSMLEEIKSRLESGEKKVSILQSMQLNRRTLDKALKRFELSKTEDAQE